MSGTGGPGWKAGTAPQGPAFDKHLTGAGAFGEVLLGNWVLKSLKLKEVDVCARES